MSAPSCILNNILVELPKAFQDEIIADGGTKFYKDTTFRPEWNVTVTGIVASVPGRLTLGDGGNHSFYPDRPLINPIVQPGDEIIFSYIVVMNRAQIDNVGDIFERDKPIDPFITTWTNPQRLRLFRVYHKNDKYECGLFNLKTKEWLDKASCDEKGAQNFIDKYLVEENIGFNYKNLLPYDGHDYWKVDYINAIAIKRKDGRFEMIGDYVLLDPIIEPKKPFEQGLIEVYEIEQETDYKAIGKVISIGEPLKGHKKLSVKPNDIICSDIRYVEKYQIYGRDYWIIHQRYLYGKSEANEYIGTAQFH